MGWFNNLAAIAVIGVIQLKQALCHKTMVNSLTRYEKIRGYISTIRFEIKVFNRCSFQAGDAFCFGGSCVSKHYKLNKR